MTEIMTPFLLDLKHGNKETAQPYAPDIDRRRKPAQKRFILFGWEMIFTDICNTF
ncbi:MAG: hypothetical protein IJ163_05770 [Bacteroidaceae bacterium]|nr:hypothetical protein [Bacteroidaceae bacterium]